MAANDRGRRILTASRKVIHRQTTPNPIDRIVINQCNSGLFQRPQLEISYEAHLSAFENTTATSAWLSRAHAYPRRQGCDQCPQSEGTGSPERVSSARATLPQTVRLRGAAQFTGRFTRRYSSRHFLILIRPGGTREGEARLGIVIGRRQAPKAVERSYLRRMIREAFRQCRNRLGQIDLVVRCRVAPGIGQGTTIRTELAELLGRTTE